MSHFDHSVLCKIYFGAQFFKVVFSCNVQGFLKLFQSSFLDIVYFSFIIGPVLVPEHSMQFKTMEHDLENVWKCLIVNSLIFQHDSDPMQ